MIARVVVDLGVRSDILGVLSIVKVVAYDALNHKIQDYPELVDGTEFFGGKNEIYSWIASQLNIQESLVEIGEEELIK